MASHVVIVKYARREERSTMAKNKPKPPSPPDNVQVAKIGCCIPLLVGILIPIAITMVAMV